MNLTDFLSPNRAGGWVLLWALTCGAISVRGDIVVNEIMFHPPPAVPEQPAKEWVELYNSGPGAVDLTGWRFTKGISFTFPSVTISAGDYLVVAADRGVFQTDYPTVTNVAGDWTGKLSNNGEKLELTDNLGAVATSLAYGSDGDWGKLRQGESYPGQPTWWRGWDWTNAADGSGSSIELLNPALSGKQGQNWGASLVPGGTPGRANSVATNDIAPMILDVRHLPAVPRSTNSVTVTAHILDEAAATVAVQLLSRVDGAADFTSTPMLDDGAHGDGLAGDGYFGATLPSQPDRTVVEFYIRATDATGHTRTWPPATDEAGTQGANALYQVEDSADAATQPIYRFIVTSNEWNSWLNLMDAVSNGRYSGAAMNATVVRTDGLGTEVRHRALLRNRGAGTRAARPHNFRLNLPADQALQGVTELDFNTRTVQAQVAGNALFSLAGLPNAYGAPAQVRVRAANLAHAQPDGTTDSYQFGSYYCFQPYGAGWAEAHMPGDPQGNIYKGVWYQDNVQLTNGAVLDWRGTNVENYRLVYGPAGPVAASGAYSKQSNVSADDWSDLTNLCYVLNQVADPNYVQAVSQRVNLEEWLRYVAINSLLINMETTLATGVGDDYSMICGVADPRFQLLNHDLDTVLGQGDLAPDYGRSIFKAGDIAALNRLLKHPEIAPRYYAALKQLADTTFAPAQVGPALDQVLGGWVPATYIQAMKAAAQQRRTNVLAQVPLSLSVTCSLPISSGFYRATSPTVVLFGRANAIDTRSVLVNGMVAAWSQWEARWTNSVILQPGINRVLLQALGATGAECERSFVDLWYDPGIMTAVAGGTLATDTTWSAVNSPYHLTGSLTIPSNLTLTIQPGATIYCDSSAGFIVNGRLLAQGTPTQRIRFSRVPGTSVSWAGFQFANARQSNVLACVDMEYGDSRANCIELHNSQLAIDRSTFFKMAKQYLEIWEPQLSIRRCVFGDLDSQYFIKAEHMLADGWYVVESNLFGSDTGDNDIMHLNRVSVKGGPVAQIRNNVFTGAGDDIIDDNETDSHIEGNLFMNFTTNHPPRSASCAVTTGEGGSTGTPNLTTQHLTVVRNIFWGNDYAILNKDGSLVQIFNCVFVNNRGGIIFDEPWRTDSGPGRACYIESSIFWNNWPDNGTDQGALAFLTNSAAFRGGTYYQGHTQVTVNNSLLPRQYHYLGAGNLDADPRFVFPTNTLALSPTNPAFATGFDGFDANTFLLANHLIPDAHLLPGSPALGTGFNGVDVGAYVPTGATVSGAPPSLTGPANATLTVAGLDIAGFRYRATGPGFTNDWSEELQPLKAVAQITLAGTTATATVPSHGYATGDVIELSGADALCPYFNGTFTIGNVTADTFDYAVAPGTNVLMNELPPKDIWCRKPVKIQLASLAAGAYEVDVVRKNTVGTWQDVTTPTVVAWTVDPALRRVLINEVLADNRSAWFVGENTPDAIELYNPGTQAVDLSGMGITDEPASPYKFAFPPGTTLDGGQYLALVAGTSTGTNLCTGFKLAREGGSVVLSAAPAGGGAPVDAVTYGPQLTDLSIGRLAGGSWGLTQPTLGAPNIAAPVGDVGGLRLNEWLAASLTRDDFVELYNGDALPVDLGGCYLSEVPDSWPSRFQVAPLSFIAARGELVFIADGNPQNGPLHLNFDLAQEWGSLGLFAPDLTPLDRVLYGPQTADVSMGRSPNGGSSLVFFPIPTPGSGNPGGTGACTVSNMTFNLMAYTQAWRYNQSNNLDGVPWYATNYNDSGWQGPGPGLLAFENNPAITNLVHTTLLDPRTPPPGLASGHAYYFRTTVLVTNDLSAFTINARMRLDDCGVIYINGAEFSRPRLPSGTITNGSFGSGAIGSNTEADIDEYFTIPASWFHAGTNFIAVEVHQVNATSSDIVWGLALDATRAITNCSTAFAVLNEVLAHNQSVPNVDGTVTDWVELYNPSGMALDMAGMGLSDDAADPRRWVFPAGAVLGGSNYLVVRFDGKSAATTINGPLLNTGFGLRAGGGAVYLFDTGASLVDALAYGPQAADFSVGRVPNGSGGWKLCLPTAGGANIVAATGDPGAVRINEWAASVTKGPDWFELYNPNPQPVALGGFYLTDKLSDRTKHLIAPLTFVGVAGGGYATFIADNDTAQGPDHVNFSLDGTLGETLGLFPAGASPAVDVVSFGPQTADVSQGRLPDGANTWAFFTNSTAGSANWLPLPNVVINEVLSHTDPPLEDAVELYNPTAMEVNVGGWYLSDDGSNPRKYRIPDATRLAAGGYGVFFQYQFDAQPGAPGSFQFSSAKGDEAWLAETDGSGAFTGYRAHARFGPQFNGVSFGRYQTSAGADFTAMNLPTFGSAVAAHSPSNQLALFRAGAGAANGDPRAGPIVVSEILYRPPPIGTNDDTQGEFIELHNITGATVPLYDTAHPTNRWRLRDAVDFDFAPGSSIPAGGYLVVVGFDPATDPAALAAFRARYGATGPVVGPWSGKLSNFGEAIELRAPDKPETAGPDAGLVPYVTIDRIAYSNAAPWAAGADGTGLSLQRANPASYGNEPTNWIAAAPNAGSSGLADTDGDGIPDAWEEANGLNKLVNDAALDPDNDGFSNLQEYLAGTNPHNSESRLRLDSITPTADGAHIRFTAAAGRTYSILYCDSVGGTGWQKLADVSARSATGPIVVIDSAELGESARFYRLTTPQVP